MCVIIAAPQYISFTVCLAIAHYGYDQFADILFIHKLQHTFYIFITDLDHGPFSISLRSTNCRLQPGLFYTVEKCKNLVILFLRKRIIFMIVAMGAFQRNTQHGLTKSIGTVGYIAYTVLLINYTALLGYFVVTVKACG